MLKIILLVMAASVPVASVWAAGPDPVTAALDSLAAAAVPSASGNEAPVWRSSLADVERSAAELLAVNRSLLEENRKLQEAAGLVNEALAAQRAENARRARALRQRQEELTASTETGALKNQLAMVREERRVVEESRAAAEARRKAAENRVALRRLKAQELEVEKKVLLVDRKNASGGALEVLETAIASLKSRVQEQKDQAAFFRQKTAGLNSAEYPHLQEALRLSSGNEELRRTAAALQTRLDELNVRLEEIAAVRKKTAENTRGKELHALQAKKAGLEQRLTAARARSEALAARVQAEVVSDKALADRIRELEKNSGDLEAELANVRENIALLDYRISALTRYKKK